MKRHTKRLIGQCSAALILLSGGIIIGTSARPGVEPVPAAQQAHAGGGRKPVAGDSVGAPAAFDTGSSVPQARAAPDVPAAPGYESFLAGTPRPEYGGEYAVLRGAATDPRSVPHASTPPAPAGAAEPAPLVAAAAASVAPGEASARSVDSVAQARPAAAPERFRPAPAQGIPRGLALRTPLLALSRSGGRVVLHELGGPGGPTPAAIEGEWAVVGRCQQVVRVEFALPARRVGELRAIGRADAGAGLPAAPVVPRQACAAAADRYARAHRPSADERAAFGSAGPGSGFEPGDLAEVALAGAGALLVFRRTGRGAAVVAATRGAGGPTVLWTRLADAADGDVSLLGVYRIGAGGQAWLIAGNPASPRMLLTASTTDMRTWSPLGSVPLREP